MRRGEIWTVAGGPDYARKPRPAVVVQGDAFEATNARTICFMTSIQQNTPTTRMPIEPTPANGLRLQCEIMVDKVHTISRDKFGQRIGRLEDRHMVRLSELLAAFLDLPSSESR